MQSFHDYYINGYSVDGHARTLELRLVRPEDSEEKVSALLLFKQVEGYLLENDLRVNIVDQIAEEPLSEFVRRNAELFAAESKWGWPLFWKRDVESTVRWLEERRSRVWSVESSYGLYGWAVAVEAVVVEQGQPL